MECKKTAAAKFYFFSSYSPLLLLFIGVGCMKVENLKMVQYCSLQFFIVLNIITRHEKKFFQKICTFQGEQAPTSPTHLISDKIERTPLI